MRERAHHGLCGSARDLSLDRGARDSCSACMSSSPTGSARRWHCSPGCWRCSRSGAPRSAPGSARRWPGRADREQDALRAAEEKVHHLVRHDALTGLPNRGVFLERLDAALAGGRRGDRMTAVLCLDLADFKAVNDTLGYAAGDLLLRHMSARLLATLRETDIAGPHGAGRVRDHPGRHRGAGGCGAAVRAPADDPGRSRSICSASRPMCARTSAWRCCPTDTRDPEQLLKQAGLALDAGQGRGRADVPLLRGRDGQRAAPAQGARAGPAPRPASGDELRAPLPAADRPRDARHGRGRGAAALASSRSTA